MIRILVLTAICMGLAHGQIACQTTADCQRILPTLGVSECQNGMCTNPYSQGCLRVLQESSSSFSKSMEKLKKRVCNSDDEHFQDFSKCEKSSFDSYTEVRIVAGDWESSIFLAWIMQILLSELLDVPVTIETSAARSAGSLSFYDVDNSIAYPAKAYNYDALKRSGELGGDCTKADRDSGDDACGHILPEVWSGQINAYNLALSEGYIEPPEGNGMVGKFSFMVPRKTAEADPSLTFFHGLQDRKKMAETFLRPTTWYDYCNLVSRNNCSTSNQVAGRFPEEPGERESYFMPGVYTGHFRATDKNNCTLNPGTCTGHVVDSPCDWDTLTESQMYWNDIALTSDGPMQPNGGYSYFQMIEIWNAANATDSPAFLWWWKPDGLDQLFADTDFAMQPTFLPPPTEECEQNRVTNVERCSENRVDRVGKSIGSCDTPAHSLQKVIATSLFTMTYSESDTLRSPAYEFIKRFRISDLSATIMLRDWVNAQIDPYGMDPRNAVCQWVYDNAEVLEEKFIPPGYPRVFSEDFSTPIFIASLACGFLSLCIALVAVFTTIKHRNRLVFRYAHMPFVLWILLGLTLVSIGSILVAPHPTNPLCVAQPYLISLGYTIELMPLVVKVSAVNHLIQESKKMRKVVINTKMLHFRVISVVVLVLIFLVVWTVVDPPTVIENAILVDQGGRVNVSTSCASSSDAWVIASYVWQGLLLLSALVLAVQSRGVKQEFNESQSLAFMVYSHTLFLVLRALIYSLPPENFSKSNLQSGLFSLCLSLDSLNTLIVYFAPKFYVIAKGIDVRSERQVNHALNMIESTHHPSLMSQNGYNTSMFDMFQEPPPRREEVKELMGEACNLLVKAAVTEDKDAERASPMSVPDDTPEQAGASPKSAGFPTKEDHFLTKPELLKLRDICTRIGRAKFDWERVVQESMAIQHPSSSSAESAPASNYASRVSSSLRRLGANNLSTVTSTDANMPLHSTASSAGRESNIPSKSTTSSSGGGGN